MGRRPMKDVLGNHLKDRLFHLVHWFNITLSLRKTSQESINLERQSYLDCSLDTLCTREEFGRVTWWLQTLRRWKRWAHQKSTQKKTQCKGSNISQSKWKIHFSSRRWTNKNCWRRFMSFQSWSKSPWNQWQRSEKDDRLLLHPTRRQNRLTARAINYSIIIWFTNLFLCLKP